MPAGRPTDYKEEYNELAHKLCLLGCTDKRLAELLETSEPTLNKWKRDFPEFLKSIKEGRDIADAEIAHATYHRAKGYSHPEDKIFNDGGEPMIVPTTKHYPPDTQAARLWLMNRHPDKWRDKQETEHTGELKIRVIRDGD